MSLAGGCTFSMARACTCQHPLEIASPLLPPHIEDSGKRIRLCKRDEASSTVMLEGKSDAAHAQ
jgi:hypothetical protein